MREKQEKYNGQFESIDTENKAYFLGILYGDGHITYNKGFKMAIGSTKMDYEIFEKLQIEFPFLKFCTYPSHPNLVYLENYEKSFITDLQKIGFVQNKKKHDLNKLFKLPTLDKSLMHHFIRGFFDADGSVYTPTRYRSRNNLRVEITLGTEHFCKELANFLKKEGLSFTYSTREKQASNKKWYPSFTLLISKREDSLAFADYIYNTSTIFLQRKYDKFLGYEKSELQLKRESFPKCPSCKSTPIYEGVRVNKNNKKSKFKCKNCNKMFSVLLPTTLEIK